MDPIERLLIDLETDALARSERLPDLKDDEIQAAKARAARLLADHGIFPEPVPEAEPAAERSADRPEPAPGATPPSRRAPWGFRVGALAASLCCAFGAWWMFSGEKPNPDIAVVAGDAAPEDERADPIEPEATPLLAQGTYRLFAEGELGQQYLLVNGDRRGELVLSLAGDTAKSLGVDKIVVEVTWLISDGGAEMTIIAGDVTPREAADALPRLGLEPVTTYSVKEARPERLTLERRDDGAVITWERTDERVSEPPMR